tara:strand:- start:84 stop:737 length:654 start_codon:yes stop_codon:yes gene_type:complete
MLNSFKKDNNFNKISCIFKELFLLIKFISYWFIIIIAFILLLGNLIINKIYKIILTGLTLILDLFESININDNRRRIIHDRQYKDPYLIRYYIFLKDRNKFPFNIFIHKFMKGDDDEDIHDHPWGFFHLILSGGYWEELPIDQNDLNKGIQKIWRDSGYWNCVSADYKHRIELKDHIKPWTIFIPLNKKKDWGFWVKKNEIWEKIQHKSYLENKKSK